MHFAKSVKPIPLCRGDQCRIILANVCCRAAAMRNPFDSSPEVIRLAVLLKLHRAVALEEWRQICAA